MYILPYSTTKEAAELKLTPKGELLKKKKELEAELKLKGMDRNPNKIVRLRKEVNDLSEKVHGKPAGPEDGKLQEELQKAKKKKLEEQKETIKKRREGPDFLRVKIKRTDKGLLENKQEELTKEEALKGDNRNPKKIERLEKEVGDLEKKVEDAEVEGSTATASHVTLIEKGIKDHEVWAIIEFSANYDNTMLKEKEDKPVDFKYEKYLNSFKGTRKGRSKKGTWKKTVKYTREEDLTPEGDFKGNASSTLLLDGNPTSQKDKFKVAIDEYVKDHMTSEGLLPYGQSVTKMKEQVKYPSKYINTKLNKTYFGADHFFTAYQGLLIEDAPQKGRKEIREKKEKELGVGKSTERDIQKAITTLEGELKTVTISERPELEKQIKKLKKVQEDMKSFSVTEEAEKTVDESRNWLLKKKKSKLERVTEEFMVENALPPTEKDTKKLRTLEKQKRKLERAVKTLQGEVREKKSGLISIASMIRDIFAVTDEWKEMTKELSKAEETLAHYEKLYKKVQTKKTDKDKPEDKPEPDKKPGKKHKDYIEELESRINENKKKIKDLKSKMETSEGKPGAFPETDNESVKDFYEIFSKAGVKRLPKMTLFGWVTPVQLLQASKQLQAVLRTKYEAKIDDIKSQKGKPEEERESDILSVKKEHKAELDKARQAIKALPADLKKRRDEFKKLHPSDFPRIKDPDWVDNSGKVSDTLKKVDVELKEVKEKDKVDKKQTVNLLEKTKFKSLGDFLNVGKKGLGIIGGRFAKAPLEAGEMPGDLKTTFTRYLEKTEADYSKAKKILDDVNKTLKDSEVSAEAEKAKAEFSRSEKALSGAKNILTHYETQAKHVPALGIAKALLGNLEYFSSLYNYYSSILWFGEKGALPTTEPEKKAAEFTKDDIDDLSEIREDIVDRLEKIASTPLYNKEAIKKDSLRARKDLKLFIDGYDDYEQPKEPTRQPSKQQLQRKDEPTRHDVRESSLPYEIITALKPMTPEERDVKKKEMYFPADLKKEVNELLKKIQAKEPSIADDARDALKRVESEVKERHKDSLNKGYLDKLFKDIKMEQGDMSDEDYKEFKKRFKDEAYTITGKIVDRINRRVINDFINSLQDVTEGKKTKKDTPYLNRRAPEEYKDMWDYVNQHLPGLSKDAPTGDTKKFIEPGKPTPTEIRKHYEEAFKERKLPVSEETLKQMEKIFTKVDLPEGGGSGARTKGRPKPKKIDPPKGTYEIQKEWLAKKIEKHGNGHEVILDVLGEAVTKLKKEKMLGNFYTGSVVDGMVALLKEVLNKMKMLKVEPPKIDVPPRGPLQEKDVAQKPGKKAPDYAGRADITINSDKEAEKVYDKMIDMIETVNDFIEPDEVNVPPQDPKRMKPGQWYLPYGLINFYQPAKKPVKADSSAMSLAYKLARNFVNTDIQSVNELTEEDIVTID